MDVYSVRAWKEIATEITLSPDHEIANIEKCLEEDFDRIEVAFREEAVQEKIESELESEMGEIPEVISFRHLSEYLDS